MTNILKKLANHGGGKVGKLKFQVFNRRVCVKSLHRSLYAIVP
jgi:hypothetical protein